MCLCFKLDYVIRHECLFLFISSLCLTLNKLSFQHFRVDVFYILLFLLLYFIYKYNQLINLEDTLKYTRGATNTRQFLKIRRRLDRIKYLKKHPFLFHIIVLLLNSTSIIRNSHKEFYERKTTIKI